MSWLPAPGTKVVYVVTEQAAPVLGCAPGVLVQDATVVSHHQDSQSILLRLRLLGGLLDGRAGRRPGPG